MNRADVSCETSRIDSREGVPIRYDLYRPHTQQEFLPVILFLHGFKGFKNWGPFPAACEDLARSGFAVCAFNFSHNGVGENPESFDRLDLFEKQTLSRDLDDVLRVVEAMSDGEVGDGLPALDHERIGILGHSRGGQTAIAAAAECPAAKAVVTWAAVADYNARWSEEMIRDWEENGYSEILNSRTGQTMRISRVVYDDARVNRHRVIALHRVKELEIPLLFLAGTGDEAVPAEDSQTLFRSAASKTKEIQLIEGAGHTFGASHPFEGTAWPDPFGDVLERTRSWFRTHLHSV